MVKGLGWVVVAVAMAIGSNAYGQGRGGCSKGGQSMRPSLSSGGGGGSTYGQQLQSYQRSLQRQSNQQQQLLAQQYQMELYQAQVLQAQELQAQVAQQQLAAQQKAARKQALALKQQQLQGGK